jgi:hypothetical protein
VSAKPCLERQGHDVTDQRARHDEEGERVSGSESDHSKYRGRSNQARDWKDPAAAERGYSNVFIWDAKARGAINFQDLFWLSLTLRRPRQRDPAENLADKKVSLNGGQVFSHDLIVEPQTKQASRVARNFKLNDDPLD